MPADVWRRTRPRPPVTAGDGKGVVAAERVARIPSGRRVVAVLSPARAGVAVVRCDEEGLRRFNARVFQGDHPWLSEPRIEMPGKAMIRTSPIALRGRQDSPCQ